MARIVLPIPLTFLKKCESDNRRGKLGLCETDRGVQQRFRRLPHRFPGAASISTAWASRCESLDRPTVAVQGSTSAPRGSRVGDKSPWRVLRLAVFSFPWAPRVRAEREGGGQGAEGVLLLPTINRIPLGHGQTQRSRELPSTDHCELLPCPSGFRFNRRNPQCDAQGDHSPIRRRQAP